MGKILASGRVLELGIPPKDIQMEEVGERATWGLAIEPVLESPPLVPLMEALNEEMAPRWHKRMVLRWTMMPCRKNALLLA